MSTGPGDWNEWGRHVLLELERQGTAHDELRASVESIRRDIRELKTRAIMYSSLAGMVASGIIITAIKLLT